MDGTRVVKTRTNQNLGNATIQQEEVVAINTVNKTDYSIAKTNQVLWFFAHLIAILLALRFGFLLLGANLTGIVLFIYSVSSVFVLPFRGVFPSPRSGESFFDTAALLGILMYYLLAYVISYALKLSSRRVSTQ